MLGEMEMITTKEELVRAWSIERALEMGGATTVESIVYRASVIEKFVKEGKTDG